MIYLFYGPDDLSRNEYLANLLARVDDPMGDLNQTRLEANKLTFPELRHACDAIPFMGDRRIIIVEGLLERLFKRGPKAFAEQLVDYSNEVPSHTRLFLLESEVDKRSTLWKRFSKLAQEEEPRVFLKAFDRPEPKALPHWIQRRARRHGGLMDQRAATELAQFVGQELRLLDQEVRKLVTYAGDRPVTIEDIQALVPYVQEATIWEMVDAIGAKDARRALASAQQILNGDSSKAIYLHIMITRQIRMLLQVTELRSLGKQESEIRSTLNLSPFVLRKVMQQAQNFTVDRLETAYEHLLETDVEMKSGADQILTLNLLITELAGRRAA